MKKKILFIIWSYTYGGGAESLLTMIVNNLNPDKYDISIIEYEHAEIKTEPVNSYVHILPYIKAVDTPEKYSKTYQLYNTPEVLIDTYIKGDYDLYISFAEELFNLLADSDGKDGVVIYIEADRAMKKLPPNKNVCADEELLARLSGKLGKDNIKIVWDKTKL